MMGEEDVCTTGLFDFILSFQRVIEYPKLIAAYISHSLSTEVKIITNAHFVKNIINPINFTCLQTTNYVSMNL